MTSFWQYLTVQIVLTEKKTSLLTVVYLQVYLLPSIVKNNVKEGLKLSNSDKGKVISLNFLERFNWEKARKNKNENNAFCIPRIRFFSYKFHNIRFEKQIPINSNRTWTPPPAPSPMLESSTRISDFY